VRIVTDEVEAYSLAQTTPPPAHLQALSEETVATQECPQMLTGPVEGRLLEMLVWVARPKLIVELGTYSGYSAQFMAAALPEDGRLITCELDPDRAQFARERFQDPRIEIRVGPALDTLATIDGPIDLAFIDADKPGYPVYYEEILARLRPNGVLLVDNVLWDGRVVRSDADDDNTKAIRAFNDMVAADDRVEAVMLPIADGLTLCRKK